MKGMMLNLSKSQCNENFFFFTETVTSYKCFYECVSCDICFREVTQYE